jgi:hypothetical protein
MHDALLPGLISLACLGWSYLCFFKPEKVKWNFTSPLSGNYYREINTLHAFGAGFMGVVCLIVAIYKLFH